MRRVKWDESTETEKRRSNWRELQWEGRGTGPGGGGVEGQMGEGLERQSHGTTCQLSVRVGKWEAS